MGINANNYLHENVKKLTHISHIASVREGINHYTHSHCLFPLQQKASK